MEGLKRDQEIFAQMHREEGSEDRWASPVYAVLLDRYLKDNRIEGALQLTEEAYALVVYQKRVDRMLIDAANARRDAKRLAEMDRVEAEQKAAQARRDEEREARLREVLGEFYYAPAGNEIDGYSTWDKGESI